MKSCSQCGEVKELSEFYYKNNSIGQEAECKLCRAERSRRYTSNKEYNRKRYLRNRTKAIARAKVHNAVKTNKIAKPLKCSRCGEQTPLHAHHEDYSKALNVTWLCVLCHKHIHGRLTDTTLIKQPLKVGA